MPESETVESLQVKIKDLERKLDDDQEASLFEGYDQCLRNLHEVVDGTQLVTWQLGPVAGLEYLLAALRNYEVDVEPERDVPHDWLSRWKVDLQ